MIIEYESTVNVVNGLEMEVKADGTLFRNSLGIEAVLADHNLGWMKHWGYVEPIEAHGKISDAENAVYTGIAGQQAVAAFVKVGGSVAAVLTETGQIICGIFRQHDNSVVVA